MRLNWLWPVVVFLWATREAQSSYPTWCGKVYQKGNPAIPPGGAFVYPIPKPHQMLYIELQPRYTIFLESDPNSELIVDVILSNLFGSPVTKISNDEAASLASKNLNFEVTCDETGAVLNSSSVRVNTTGNIVTFDTNLIKSRLKPYQITLTGNLSDSEQNFIVNTEIYILPSRNYGSAVKIDKLYGGSFVQNSLNNYSGWYPIYPHGMFADTRATIPPIIDFTPLDVYANLGFNMIIPVPDGAAPEQSFNYSDLMTYWDRLDEMNLFNIYSLQFAYQNQTRIETQINMWKDRNSLYSYHIADEPDGWHHPVENTRQAYNQIKALDPYHPIQLVLNCQNFYYTEYTKGADIVLEDVYPIGTNPLHSVLWDTPCNSTYGDCGCDNGRGIVSDVSDRLDTLYSYQSNIENAGNKPIWATIQAFEKQDYWLRQPSSEEVVNMVMLAINHDAKGISYWLYTKSDDQAVKGAQSIGKILQKPEVIKFLFGSMAIKNLPFTGPSMIDVSAWILGDQMMIGIAAVSSAKSDAPVTIILPTTAEDILQQPYGNSRFTLTDNILTTGGMKTSEVNILILSLGQITRSFSFHDYNGSGCSRFPLEGLR